LLALFHEIGRVEPDGRYFWRTRESSYGQSQLQDCMREEMRRAVVAVDEHAEGRRGNYWYEASVRMSRNSNRTRPVK
jgi:hypothetical protein